MEPFIETTRVQIPAMVHLTRLGYKYLGKFLEQDANTKYNGETNIVIDEFVKKFTEFNNVTKEVAKTEIEKLSSIANNEDLGEEFYNRITKGDVYKYIDFDTPSNNSFGFTAEFTCYGTSGGNYRPDVTIFVNGLPLAYLEVKKKNNPKGMIVELEREAVKRSQKQYNRFRNITQITLFSNNMPYNNLPGVKPDQGNFYSTPNRKDTKFNCFREEKTDNQTISDFINNYPYLSPDDLQEREIVRDFNVQSLLREPEYKTNKDKSTPCNQLLTSLLSPERFLYMLKYGISFLNFEKEVDGELKIIHQKHIMRYQQFFASMAVRERIDKTGKGGIIWHTQGSGKTALSYNLTRVLNDYYSKKDIVPKYYFIVDRLDLLSQAYDEFEMRGLKPVTVNSREELMKEFRQDVAINNNQGKPQITVVNIHKFKEDHSPITVNPYGVNLQRIFIIDEAHRGYKAEGSFLGNLLEADRKAIKIALTGTPLINEEKASWKIFGDYIHTYYYDKSIEDGYTLQMVREDIETTYKMRIDEAYNNSLDELKIKYSDVKREQIVKHPVYVKAILDYIINDFLKFRFDENDDSLGGMIVCENGKQAEVMEQLFPQAVMTYNGSHNMPTSLVARLVNYATEDDIKKNIINDFKKNFKVDILIVDYMLLTGFDAPRLKKMYLGKKLKDHNLLQALTRVNRPYISEKTIKNPIRYGRVVDFADIKENFEESNNRYLAELNKFLTGETDTQETGGGLDTILIDTNTILTKLEEDVKVFDDFPIHNVETLTDKLNQIDDLKVLRETEKKFEEIKDFYNVGRSANDEKIQDKLKDIDMERLRASLRILRERINFIRNIYSGGTGGIDIDNHLFEVLQNIMFKFNKTGEEILEIKDGGSSIGATINSIQREMNANLDQHDPEYITICEAINKRLREKGAVINSLSDYEEYLPEFKENLNKLVAINKRNKKISSQYKDDRKFVSVHNRIREKNQERKEKHLNPVISDDENQMINILSNIKSNIDDALESNANTLNSNAYFERMISNRVARELSTNNINTIPEDIMFISQNIYKQYIGV